MLIEVEDMVERLVESVQCVNNPRYFQTERGYQGALVTQLSQRFSPRFLVEQEYQKREREHGVRNRPDIVIHEPFDQSRHRSRSDGNLAVVELKLRARQREAKQAIGSICEIIRNLSYDVGFFVNVDSPLNHRECVPGLLRQQIICIATRIIDGEVHVIR